MFGSEPKACFAHPAVKPELDKQGLQELLAIGPAHTSGLSLFKDLFEVLPGHFMIYSQNGLHDETYWELTSREHTESYQDTVAHTRFLVEDAIKKADGFRCAGMYFSVRRHRFEHRDRHRRKLYEHTW